MSMQHDPGAWGNEHFGGAELGDVRRTRRVVKVATELAAHPGASIPRAFETPYEVKAAYNLFRHPTATPEHLQAPHRALVLSHSAQVGTTLFLEDTSEVAWHTERAITGLGPVGQGRARDQGFLLHSVLAVRWAGESDTPCKRPVLDILGLADQQYHVRAPIPAGENGNGSQHRMHRERESTLWERAGRHLGPAPSGCHWLRVCDRGADIYEFLRACGELHHGFVVRAAQDRGLVGGGNLYQQATALVPWGTFSLVRRRRQGRPARMARLQVAATPVLLRSPQRPGHAPGGLPPVACTLVRVWEADPPDGEEALDWRLLVDKPVTTYAQALEAALQYATRWVIEDFHKALKTGLGAERLQLEDAHRLFAAISVMSIVALRLLDLREHLRLAPAAPAREAGLDDFELAVLGRYLHRRLATTEDVALAIGRLGGHMNRKADGPPGLLTLWHGMTKLQALVAGARLGLQLGDLGKA